MIGDKFLKAPPQGSLFGPFMYNVFSNDLLFILDKLNDISYDTAHTKLLAASDIMISWFENNNLQANPNKFQLIVFEEANEERSLAIPWRLINNLHHFLYIEN